jgi:carbon monoxide dehydrogenase subunit G
MDFTGRYEIPATPEWVWAALNDPSVLQACIPGCEQLTRRDERHLDAVASLRVGPLKTTFRATIEQCELDPPQRCVLIGEGRGGAAGFGRGEAEIVLAPHGAGTLLTYTARAAIGGKLAKIGQRLIDGAAQQIADDFFARFVARLPSQPAPPAMESEESEHVADGVEQTDEARREGLAPEIWVIGLIAVIVLLLVLFGVAL